MAGHYTVPDDTLKNYTIHYLEFDKSQQLIGSGAYGRILGAKWEGTSVAVKEIHSLFKNVASDAEFRSFKEKFLQECERSRQLCHPNIVQFLGIYWPVDPEAVWARRLPSLVMERLDCSLDKLLKDNSYIPVITKLSIVIDVSLGLRYLHSRLPQPIIHRDLSSNNVLISKRMEGKIGDLGTARFVNPDKLSKMTRAPGTIDFMPPEALASNCQYGKEIDVFSFGCVMLHTFSHCDWPTPLTSTYPDPKTKNLLARNEAERRQDYFDKIQQFSKLTTLIECCLADIPNDRESIVNVSNRLQEMLMKPLNVLILQQKVNQKEIEMRNKDSEIQRLNAGIQTKDSQIQSKADEIQKFRRQFHATINRKDAEIKDKSDQIQSKEAEIAQKNIIIQEKEGQLKLLKTELEKTVQDMEKEIKSQKTTLQRRAVTIKKQDDLLKSKDREIQDKTSRLNEQIKSKETEIHRKVVLIQNKDDQIRSQATKLRDLEVNNEKLKSEYHILTSKLNKGSIDFWKRLRVNLERCADLPKKCWATSIAELDGNVYITVQDSTAACLTPYVYNFVRKEWVPLPDLPYVNASLVSVPSKNQLLAIGGCKKNDENVVEVSRQVFQWDAINKKWVDKYPMMSTPRFSFSSISHESIVIVVGGVTCYSPWTITRAVEILTIKEGRLPVFRSSWATVEQLPYAVYDAVPLIFNDSLYIAGGFDKRYHSTCSIVTASLPALQKSSNNNTSSSQVWNKLPDMPYSSYSITHYQGRLIAFTEEKSDGGKQIQKIYLYNPDADSWDYTNHFIPGHNWGRSIPINDHMIFVVGGTTGTIRKDQDDHLVTTCYNLSFAS